MGTSKKIGKEILSGNKGIDSTMRPIRTDDKTKTRSTSLIIPTTLKDKCFQE